MISVMSRKRILAVALTAFLVFALSACGNSEEKKEEKEIMEVAQKYFDALRIGDEEGEYDCYLPTKRQERDAERGLLGYASKLILRVDLSEVLLDLETLFGEESRFANYKYKAAECNLDEDGAEAVVYVDVYEEKELRGSVRVDMTKYGGSWYVVKGTIADDDRELNGEAISGGVEAGELSVEEGDGAGEPAAGDGNKAEAAIGESAAKQPGQIWKPILAAVILAAVAVSLVLFLRARSSRKYMAPEIPFISLPEGKIEPGDILCSCGTINPAGIRTCMGCGKKIKRRR